MAVILSDNFNYVGKKPNFERDIVNTKVALKNMNINYYCEGNLVFCKENKKFYTFIDTYNDLETGHFKRFDFLNTNIGTTEERPVLTEKDNGTQYYDTTIKQLIFWDGKLNRWANYNGHKSDKQFGTTNERPILTVDDKVYQYYDTDIDQLIFWIGDKWVNYNGFKPILNKGTTEERPILEMEDCGFQYFDTTLLQTIFWNGDAWINSDGTLTEKVIIL